MKARTLMCIYALRLSPITYRRMRAQDTKHLTLAFLDCSISTTIVGLVMKSYLRHQCPFAENVGPSVTRCVPMLIYLIEARHNGAQVSFKIHVGGEQRPRNVPCRLVRQEYKFKRLEKMYHENIPRPPLARPTGEGVSMVAGAGRVETDSPCRVRRQGAWEGNVVNRRSAACSTKHACVRALNSSGL
jgi:hypothetical protein